MDQLKILVADDVSESGLAPLRAAGFALEKRTGLRPEELRALLPDYEGLIVRSETKVTAEVSDAGARLERLLVLLAVVAWRILATQQRNRTAPAQPCTAVLSQLEWEALWCRVHQQPVPPATPPTLGEAVRWLAQLGGFLGRPQDGEPGVTVLWRGYRHLADLTAMYAVMRQSHYEPL